MTKFDCIEKRLSRLFYRYGHYVSLNPLPFIVVPLFLTAIASIGFLYLRPITDAIYLFTPTNAPSKRERAIIHNLWPLHDHNYIPGRTVTQSREVQLIVVAKNGANILEPSYSEAIYRLDSFIQNHINVTYENRTYGYNDLCLMWRNAGCPGNKHVHIVSDLFNHGINISYPTIRFGTTSGYIGGSIGGVSLMQGRNNSSIIAKARAWLMIYHLKFFPPPVSHVSGLWEKEMERQLLNYTPDPYITFTFLHSQSLPEELRRNANSLIPRFIIAFTVLVIFSTLCSIVFIDGTFYVDWVLSKPILSLFGVINAAMGIITGIGITNFLGIPSSDIVGVMPFLLVAVGTDNMFLMVAALRHTNRAHEVSRRIGECMSDAAISILITSLTDAFSFGIGAITTIPAVQIFCIYTCIAISATFLYQITFFCALLSLTTEWERSHLHCVFLRKTVGDCNLKKLSLMTKLFWLGSRTDVDPKNLAINLRETGIETFFRDWFAPVLMQPIIRILSGLWFIIYISIAIYGCMHIKEGLEPVNLLVDDSYAIPHYRFLEKYFWHYGAPLQVVVNNAPDLRNASERQRIMQMVQEFANTKHSIGDDGVQFWLKEMEIYYKELGADIIDSAIYGLAEHFLSAKSYDVWSEDLIWSKDSDDINKVKTFRFIVGMKQISETRDQEEATLMMREVASHYHQYNITTFMPLWLFTDQYAIVVPNTIQNIVIALIVMIIIAVLLIPQPLCSFWVAVAIASIDLGVIGYMTLWNVNLDAISMITIIMSIGFSVDYSAHITYGYVVAHDLKPNERVQHALATLGWPLTQGAVTTILSVLILSDIPAYMIVTFFKTVFLSITIGLAHGLIFLPVTLSLFVRQSCIMETKSANKIENAKRETVILPKRAIESDWSIMEVFDR